MSTLKNYLDLDTIRQVQELFSAMTGLRIRVLGADGLPIADDGAAQAGAAGQARVVHEAAVSADSEVLGKVLALQDGPAGEADGGLSQRLVSLLATMLGRFCKREVELRSRAEELATLYRLTGEFTGQRDLKSLLDLVARTVTEVLKGKACSIRLLSEDRNELVMAAVHNLSPEYLRKGRILLSASLIDQEVLTTLKPVYIADEQTDQRVLFPAQAKQEGIVSALCMPMIYRGRAEGVIRVYMAQRHEFDWFETALLGAVAAEAAAAIVNARLYQEAISSTAMRRQVMMAAEVQRRMIPSDPPKVPGIDIGAVYVPSYELGGDFYDFLQLPPDNLGLAVCDVVGKGVRASLLMASIRASLRAHAANIYDMSAVVARVNRDLCADTLVSDFATLFYCVIDFKARRFTYANAGHTPPLLIRGGQVCHLSTGGGVLGIEPNYRWGHEAFLLESGDVIVAYTDGLSDAANFEEESFGHARVEKAVTAAIAQNSTAEGIVKHVLWEMRRFSGLQTSLDDLTLVAIKVL